MFRRTNEHLNVSVGAHICVCIFLFDHIDTQYTIFPKRKNTVAFIGLIFYFFFNGALCFGKSEHVQHNLFFSFKIVEQL